MFLVGRVREKFRWGRETADEMVEERDIQEEMENRERDVRGGRRRALTKKETQKENAKRNGRTVQILEAPALCSRIIHILLSLKYRNFPCLMAACCDLQVMRFTIRRLQAQRYGRFLQ